MAESETRQFIEARKHQLLQEIAALEARIGPLQKELADIMRVETALSRKTPAIRKSTIKDHVLQALEGYPNGLQVMDIVSHINASSGRVYDRTSVSPQLSRLCREGRIMRRGFMWVHRLAIRQDNPNET